MKNIVLKSGKRYSLKDFNLDTITKNEELLSELDMNTLPKTLYGVLGVYPIHLYKPILLKKIEQYDKSDEVNSFLIKKSKFWLDKNTRIGLMYLANCSTDNIQLVLGEQILTIPVDAVKNFLQQLEVYAGQCYLQTQKHLIAAKDLKTIEDIINYDYTKGYPDKLNLDEYIDLA